MLNLRRSDWENWVSVACKSRRVASCTLSCPSVFWLLWPLVENPFSYTRFSYHFLTLTLRLHVNDIFVLVHFKYPNVDRTRDSGVAHHKNRKTSKRKLAVNYNVAGPWNIRPIYWPCAFTNDISLALDISLA
jgi:hypothetical protein